MTERSDEAREIDETMEEAAPAEGRDETLEERAAEDEDERDLDAV